MLAPSKHHWATLLAIGLPLLAGGCAGGGASNPDAQAASATARATHVDAQILADRLKAEGNFSSAASMYQQAHQANPGDARPLLGLAECLLAMGANAEAAEAYGGALAVQPNNLDALRGLGHARILLGQPQFALTQYQTAAKLAPTDVRILNGLGVAHDMVGDHKAAQQTYRSVLAIDANNQSAQNNMALSLALTGDNDGAIRMLEELSKSSTASTLNRQNLALLYGVSGKLDQAEQVGRADLPDDVVRRNIAALNANADPAARQELLKQSLGVELKGRQYSPAAQPVMPLTNLAQASATDQPVYLSTDEGGALPLITTGNAGQASTTRSTNVALKSTGDAWSDEWDEELVGAGEEPLPQVPLASAVAPVQVAAADAGQPASSPFLSSKKAIGEEKEKPAAAAGATQSAEAAPRKVQEVAATATVKPMAETTATATPAVTAPVQTAAAQPEAATVTVKDLGGAKVYTVQIASYRSESEATAGWQAVSAEQKDLLAGLTHSVAKADLGAEKGIFYRLHAGSFGDKTDAKALCSDLKSRSVDCMVVEASAPPAAAPAKTRQSVLAPDEPFIVAAR